MTWRQVSEAVAALKVGRGVRGLVITSKVRKTLSWPRS
jgi:hypothetical protein